jgi:hypothetical protein
MALPPETRLHMPGRASSTRMDGLALRIRRVDPRTYHRSGCSFARTDQLLYVRLRTCGYVSPNKMYLHSPGAGLC